MDSARATVGDLVAAELEGRAIGPVVLLQPEDVLLVGNLRDGRAAEALHRALHAVNPNRRVICFTGGIDVQLLRGVDPSEAEPVALDVDWMPGEADKASS